MQERPRDGGFGTFLDTMHDLQTRTPDQNEHQELTRQVAELPEQEVRDRFVRLMEAVNPNTECSCSDLSQVAEGEARVCAYHSSRAGWIVHQARQLLP